jgi:hypothetical protein
MSAQAGQVGQAPDVGVDPMVSPAGPPATMRQRARRAYYGILQIWPRAYCRTVRRRVRTVNVATPGVHLVIEGFPRSGNTFAREAVIEANPGLHVASHLHRAAHVIHAVDLGIPALVLVRDPVDAVASFLFMNEYRTVDAALRAYCRFYRRLWRHRDRFVVATFDQVVSDLGAVIERLNAFSGTNMIAFDHNPTAMTAILCRIEAAATEGGSVDELRVARPSIVRTMAAAQVLTTVQAGDPTLLRACEAHAARYRALSEAQAEELRRADGAGRTRPRRSAVG